MMVLRTSKYRCYECVGINIFLNIGSGKYYYLGGPVYVVFIFPSIMIMITKQLNYNDGIQNIAER